MERVNRAKAVKAIRRNWSPLFVRSGDNVPDGNRQLIASGALPIVVDDLDVVPASGLVRELLDRAARDVDSREPTPAQRSLLDGREPPIASASHQDGIEEPAPDDDSPTRPHPGQLAFGEEF